MILILTRADDDHTDAVISDLRQRGAEFVPFETSDLPQSAAVTLRCVNSG
jgi:hypothetical protein